MTVNLNDVTSWIKEIFYRLRKLESGAFLENSSISNGRMRFIGGLLRIDSGGRVEIVGTLQVDGTTDVTGEFTVSGPWNLTGNGEITGDYTVTGKVTHVGDMDIDGVLTVNGDGWSITGDGEISGRVNLTGSFEVAVGGYIQVGPVRISGAAEGFISSLLAVVFNTPQLRVNGSARVEQSLVVNGQLNLANLVPIAKSLTPDGSPVGSLYIDASGDVYRVVPG
jgi:hypothetical protein